jgi:hypothetical protein
MKKSILILFFFASALFSMDSTFIADSSYCIFKSNERKFEFEFNKKTEYWTPSIKEVKQIEPILRNYLEKEGKNLSKKLGNYKRQYTGIIIGKHNILFINFFCGDDPNFRTKEIFVKDGGDCFFRIKIDMENHKCFDLIINGEA